MGCANTVLIQQPSVRRYMGFRELTYVAIGSLTVATILLTQLTVLKVKMILKGLQSLFGVLGPIVIVTLLCVFLILFYYDP